MNNVVVVGGAGFIGSHLVDRLIDEGYKVTVIDDMSNGELAFVNSHCNLLVCDMADSQFLSRVSLGEWDTVFNLAAQPRVGFSVDYPVKSNTTNVDKTLQLLDACRVGKIRRFVNTSSSSVYGNTSVLPTVETVQHFPRSPYALQKSIMEQYCRLFSGLYGLDTVSIRPFNVFGERQKGNSAYSTAISAWLFAIKHGFPMRSDGDGEQTRDMTHVSNVVDVFIRAARHPERLSGEAFNAGTGTSISNNKILNWMKREFPNASVVMAPERPGDVKHTLASVEKTRRVLQYEVLTPFTVAIERTKQWAMSDPIF